MTRVNNTYVPSQDDGKDPFFCPRVEGGGEFESLEPGCYDAVAIGVAIGKFKKFQSEELVDKIYYIFQVSEGGQTYYFKSKQMTPIISERSNRFAFVSSWTGCTLEKMTDGYHPAVMVGYPAQVVIGPETNATTGKTYSTLKNVLKLKKGAAKPQAIIEDIPNFLVARAENYKLLDGMGVKPPVAPKGATNNVYVPSQMNDQQPDFGMGNPPPMKQTDIPHVPSNAKVTQAPDAKGWITQPAPQPAGAVPDVGTTAPEEDDGDSDLPF